MIPFTDHECRLKLDEIYRGDCIIVPSSYEHALNILQVTHTYVNNQQQATIDLLKKEHV